MFITTAAHTFAGQPLWSGVARFTAQARVALSAFAVSHEPGLSAILRESVSAVETNIAEACADPDGSRCAVSLRIALGFAEEVSHALDEAYARGYMTAQHVASLHADLSGLRASIESELAEIRADAMPTPEPMI